MDKILKSEILSRCPEIIHGVSTKLPVVGVVTNNTIFSNNMSKYVGDDIGSVMKNRAEYYTALGIDSNAGAGNSRALFAHANQIHSADVTAVNDAGLYPKTDALITNTKEVFLIISVADCLPVMLYDTKKHVIGNVHSGWRGTAKGIVTAAIAKMMNEFGSDTRDIIAFMGPGISCENFEVGGEVAEMFDEKYVRPPRLARTIGAVGEPPLLKTGGELKRKSSDNDKFYIDLKAVVKDQLLGAGVKPGNIDTCPYCTFQEKDMLHSYRRDRDKSGRMFAVIGIRGN